MSLTNVLAGCVTEKLKALSTVQAKSNPHCFCVVRFKYSAGLETFQDIVKPLLGNFERREEFLFQLCPDFDSANALARRVESLAYDCGQKYLEVPFEPNWLAKYLAEKDAGIDLAYVSNVGMHESQIPAFIEKSRRDVESRNDYLKSVSQSTIEASKTSTAVITKSFVDFLQANWEGFESPEHVGRLVNKLIVQCEKFAAGLVQLPSYPCLDITSAIESKIAYLEDSKGHSRRTRQEKRKSLSQSIDDISRKRNLHTSWQTLRGEIKEIIESDAAQITPKGFSRKLDGENTTYKLSPFKGISFAHEHEYDMNQRLHPKNLCYYVQEQGYNLIDLLAGAFSAYFLKIIELRQCHNLEQILIEFSETLDSKYETVDFESLVSSCIHD